MSFEERGEAVIGAHSLEDLKLVFRVLHSQLTGYPELMDTHFVLELQNYLHRQAKADGVDVSHHGDWDRWLGNIPERSCERDD